MQVLYVLYVCILSDSVLLYSCRKDDVVLAYFIPETANYSVLQLYSKTPWPCFVNPEGAAALGLEMPKREKKRKAGKQSSADESVNVAAGGGAAEAVPSSVSSEPFKPSRSWALGRVAVNDTCAVKKVHCTFLDLLQCYFSNLRSIQ